jgi:hypothetical protein
MHSSADGVDRQLVSLVQHYFKHQLIKHCCFDDVFQRWRTAGGSLIVVFGAMYSNRNNDNYEIANIEVGDANA